MKKTKLHPIIFIKSSQDVFIKQISDFEELQLFSEKNMISDYFKLGTKIDIDDMSYTIKSFRFILLTSENLSYDGTAYNLCLDIIVD